MTLAEMLGVDQATVSRWESCRQVPDLGTQRRLRALMLGAGPRDEALLKHWVNTAIGQLMLTDAHRVIVAASSSLCAVHGLLRTDVIGRSAAPIFTDELESLYWQVVERGFFEGEVASATVVSRFNTLSGTRRGLAAMVVWTPVHLSSGDILRRVDRTALAEDEFERARERNRGPIRIVTLDDLSR